AFPAGSRNRPASVSAGRPFSGSWRNHVARPMTRPTSHYFQHFRRPGCYNQLYMDEGCSIPKPIRLELIEIWFQFPEFMKVAAFGVHAVNFLMLLQRLSPAIIRFLIQEVWSWFQDVVVQSFGIVTTSRYVVPTGRVKVPAGRYVVPTGKDNVIVSAGRSKVIPAGRTILVLEVIILISLASLRLKDLSRAGATVINRSLYPFLEDYIELNDLNESFELRRNQRNDLMPTIEEGEVIEEFRTRNEDLDTRIDDYPRALMNVPIFVGTFSVMTDFAVLENMDAYHDEGMGDVIFGEPFLREVDIKAKRFEGMITLYKGDDEVTYQMARSHPRFKHHTNEQCNKIPPLLKVNEKDMMNGVSHAYQKLKGFYKVFLNLGPNYIRNAKTEDWLTRGHISVHELD
ncbi:hypothetical protein Tco_0810653, partial [Tanacetum coccineum]